ncbi:Ufm1-specific protease 2 [Schistosoma japonicum]|nr:Ufm1-specific protease 2 [Schistosoma japonicum]KAH8865252.1 Ufm1-specific protease 2 [Schistosoma japonicum]KAH8865253.1 Ufm1-specific protease 2 [Schistosoma japonicum]
MELCESLGDLSNDSRWLLLRIFSQKPVYIRFSTEESLFACFQKLKMLLTSAVFVHNNLCLTASSTNEHSSKMLHSFSKLKNSVNLASLVVFFSLDINSSKHTPTLQLSHQPSVGYFHHIPIDLVCDLKDDELIHSALCTKLSSFLDSYHRALLFLWRELQFPPKKLVSYHYVVKSSMYSLRLPRRIKESREGIWRKVIHEKLGFPLDTPLFRRGQALHPVPTIVNWLGPSSELLVCPHEVVKQPPNVGPTYIVTGRYTYKHYLQDGVDDRNWGCAYRSLQTLISWLMWQGEITPGPLPSLRDIQASIVRFGDKPKSFIGSCQWIGSLEVSYCLLELYNIQCRLLHIPQGHQMSQLAASALTKHFTSGGGPVMVGGGQLAHTIIGIQLCESTLNNTESSSYRYLILDPHYTGPLGNIKIITEKGWCGWKLQSFWKSNVHYNLCLLPPIRSNRV